MNQLSSSERDYAAELDQVSARLDRLVSQLLLVNVKASNAVPVTSCNPYQEIVGYSQYQPLAAHLDQLQAMDTTQTADIFHILSYKQRLDMIYAIMHFPMTDVELAAHLNISKTKQLSHHIEALLASGILIQVEQDGKYKIPTQLTEPLLCLLTGITKLLVTSEERGRATIS